MTDICTCRWSLVNSATICPPYIIQIDPDCPHHGHEAPPEPDPDEARERKREFERWEEPDDRDEESKREEARSFERWDGD